MKDKNGLISAEAVIAGDTSSRTRQHILMRTRAGEVGVHHPSRTIGAVPPIGEYYGLCPPRCHVWQDKQMEKTNRNGPRSPHKPVIAGLDTSSRVYPT